MEIIMGKNISIDIDEKYSERIYTSFFKKGHFCLCKLQKVLIEVWGRGTIENCRT